MGWVQETGDEYSTPGARQLARDRTRLLVPLAADHGLVTLLASAYLQGIRDCVETISDRGAIVWEKISDERKPVLDDIIPGMAI